MRIDLFDVTGRHLARLADHRYGPGPHAVVLPADLGNGVCFTRLESEEGNRVCRAVRIH